MQTVPPRLQSVGEEGWFGDVASDRAPKTEFPDAGWYWKKASHNAMNDATYEPLYNKVYENTQNEVVEAVPFPGETALVVVAPDAVLVELLPARAIDQNPAAVYLAGLAAGSRRAMSDSLAIIARLLTGGKADALTLDWSLLRFQHTAAVRSQLAEKYSAATTNKMLSALRGTLKAAWRLGQIPAEEYQKAVDIDSVLGESLPAGRSLSAGELVALMEACQRDETPLGTRDAAILALLYGCGLRRAELVMLDVVDYDAEAGSLKVRGKRNKQRLVPVVRGAAEAVNDWLGLRGQDAGPLFVQARKGERLLNGRLTTQAIYKQLLARAKQANVAHFSPHDCRRTFVGDLLDRGADIATVQKLAGHANVTTTARYDRRGEAVKRKAAEMLHVPYSKR